MNIITKNSKIAVVGAGISGLAVAIGLKMKEFRYVTVYEKDRSVDARRQGYGLTILQGKKVLRELGVLEEAKKMNSPTKAHYFFNHRGQILGFYGTLFWDGKQQKSKKWSQKGLSMHIPRNSLRTILLDRYTQLSSYQPTKIEWNKQLTKVTCLQDKIQLTFNQGSKVEADWLLGCDGIFSSVRKMTLEKNEPLRYLGVMVVLGICSSDHTLSQQRVFQSSNGHGRFYSMPFDKNSPSADSMWQFSIPMQEQIAQHYQQNPQKAKQFMLHYCKQWHQPIPSLINATSTQNIMTLPAYDREPNKLQLPNNRIILLGDACHPMSPFKSQGANQSLLDAYNLAELASKESSFEEIGIRFTAQSFNRTKDKVMKSRERVKKYHDPDYLKEETYLYPKIDGRLIQLLRQRKIDSATVGDLEEAIKSIMLQNGYVKP